MPLVEPSALGPGGEIAATATMTVMDSLAGGARGQADPPAPLPAGDDERDLIGRILQRDRKAAAQFVAAHIDAVYRYARYRLAPRADLVEDLVQDVFLAALSGLSGFQGQSSLRTWVLGIARHKIEDIYRRRLRASDVFDDTEAVADQALSETASLDEQLDAARAQAKTRAVLSRLPERYGLILLWRYWEQRSTRDIAMAIGTTEKSVERMLARARAQFKELWVKE
jgi:RNA polymerase sigma-70 factor (ECF subfamily)